MKTKVKVSMSVRREIKVVTPVAPKTEEVKKTPPKVVVKPEVKKIKKIVVMGGNGFIGGHVVDNLITKGYEVTVFGRLNDYKLPENVKFFLGDIKDREAVLKVISLNDAAINLAGILGTAETVDNPFPSVLVNIMGSLNFYEAIRQYKIPAVQITVGNHFMHNSYAITKTTAERFALMYNREHKTKIAVIRGLNAYGERQKHKPVRKIIPNFIIRALRGEAIEIFGKGESIMDMIYVKDLAEILVRAVTQQHWAYDRIMEAGTGVRTNVNEIAQMVNKLSGNVKEIVHLPMRKGEPKMSVVIGKPATLKPLFPEEIKLTTLEEGLKKTITWYKENYDIKNL